MDPDIGETDAITFDSLELHPKLLSAIAKCGFTECTPIQAETLPVTLSGKDVIGRAQTGTGKTAAFLITAFEYLLTNPLEQNERYASEPRVLVLAPTRELALQIEKDARQLNTTAGFNILSTVGGMNYDKQRDSLQHYVVDILVATPGRLIDFLEKGDLYLDQIDVLIIDEADRMLDMGFIPDIKRILRRTTAREYRQTLLFSATFNQDVLGLASQWTSQAEYLEIKSDTVAAATIEQTVLLVEKKNKRKVLLDLLKKDADGKFIIFTNRRDIARDLEKFLKRNRIRVELLSGEVIQSRRIRVLDNFKNNKVKVIVATDVAGRGLHVDDISHVINFNLPDDPEDYVHRIGRTGRAGKEGVAITLACEDEAFAIPDIERYLGLKLHCVQQDQI
ncbi:MAG: ATP-dependent RNA helicase RhlB [Gammaproteobacteria bacterium]|nr:MAG: ATP-dependent RNA helicase RhlB [Pseudomonadota bacterium]PIE39083.1 MAG: ATP-dependent RNA helicase RhlB [Gammaproteobacteria bacterium]